MRLITIAGTWGERSEKGWFDWGSPFWEEALKAGAQPLKLADAKVKNPKWSSALEGIWGANDKWQRGGIKMAKFIKEHTCYGDPVSVIAHSHGGQVAHYGISMVADRNPITLITVATPVRKDMQHMYKYNAGLVDNWIHIHSDWRDIWQFFGGLFDWSLKTTRKMKYADENVYHPESHSDLMDPELWTEENWWRWVTD